MSKRLENLMPIEEVNSRRTPEEHRAASIKAGKASVRARREKKKLREMLEIYLEMKDDSGLSNKDKITLALLKQAEKGNVKAYETIRDTIGEKPVEMIGFQDIELEIEDETETE